MPVRTDDRAVTDACQCPPEFARPQKCHTPLASTVATCFACAKGVRIPLARSPIVEASNGR